jgi:alpha-glucoside transport system permease protein
MSTEVTPDATTQGQTPPPPQVIRHSKEGTGAGSAGWPVRIVLILLCTVWMIPILGILITSFRTRDAADSTGWWYAIANPLDFSQWTLQNYEQVLKGEGVDVNMGQAFLNSILVAVPATVIPILAAAFAAYAFTFMHWRGRDIMFVIFVGLLVVPNQVALVPLLKLYGVLGINQTFLAVWLAHAGFGMPLAVYILRNYMSGLPNAVIESAKIDGASHFTTFWRLIIPMSTPALASFAIFQFLWVWNDLLIALLFLGRGENTILTVGMTSLLGNQGQGWQLLTAAGFVTMVLPIIVFLSLQRYFIRGMTSGAVKG